MGSRWNIFWHRLSFSRQVLATLADPPAGLLAKLVVERRPRPVLLEAVVSASRAVVESSVSNRKIMQEMPSSPNASKR